MLVTRTAFPVIGSTWKTLPDDLSITSALKPVGVLKICIDAAGVVLSRHTAGVDVAREVVFSLVEDAIVVKSPLSRPIYQDLH